MTDGVANGHAVTVGDNNQTIKGDDSMEVDSGDDIRNGGTPLINGTYEQRHVAGAWR